MGIGEYAGILTFGIVSTGAIAYRPEDLPLFIIGAFVFSLLIMKATNWSFYKISSSKINFVIWGIISGAIASIGFIVASNNGLVYKLNGILWMFLGIAIMKFSNDDILQ